MADFRVQATVELVDRVSAAAGRVGQSLQGLAARSGRAAAQVQASGARVAGAATHMGAGARRAGGFAAQSSAPWGRSSAQVSRSAEAGAAAVARAQGRIGTSAAQIGRAAQAASRPWAAATERIGRSASTQSQLIDRFARSVGGGIPSAPRPGAPAPAPRAPAGAPLGQGDRHIERAAHLGEVARMAGDISRRIDAVADVGSAAAASAESQLARVGTVLTVENTGGDVDAAKERIRQAAFEAATGASEIVGDMAAIQIPMFYEATFTGVSSGLSDQQAIAATERSAILGAGADASVQEASTLLNTLFNTFGDRSVATLTESRTEFARLADLVARTQQYFAFEDLQQLGDGLKNAAGASLNYGLPLEQLSAILGALNTLGITGPEAGTATAVAIEQLSVAAGKLGFQVQRGADGSLDFVRTLQEIAAGGFSPEQLSSAFGVEAARAVGLLLQGQELLSGGMDALDAAAGASDRAAAERATTFEAAQARLEAKTAALSAELGRGQNAVRGWGQAAADAAANTAVWVASLPGGETITSIAGGAMQVAASAAQGAAGISEMALTAASLTTMLRGTRVAMVLYRIATLGAAAAQAAFSWPILLVVAGIAALALGAYLVIRHWDRISDFFTRLWNGVKTKFEEVWLSIKLFALEKWQEITEPFRRGLIGKILGIEADDDTATQAAIDKARARLEELQAAADAAEAAGMSRFRGHEFVDPLARAQEARDEQDPETGLNPDGTVSVVRTPEQARAYFFGAPSPTDALQDLAPGAAAASGEAAMVAMGVGAQDGAPELGRSVEQGYEDHVEPLNPQSDAERGPLSRLTDAGRAIPETMAAGAATAAGSLEAVLAALALPTPDIPLGPVPELAVATPDMPELALPTPDIPLGPVPELAVATPDIPLGPVPELAVATPDMPELALPTPDIPLGPVPELAVATPDIPLGPVPELALPTPDIPLGPVPELALPAPGEGSAAFADGVPGPTLAELALPGSVPAASPPAPGAAAPAETVDLLEELVDEVRALRRDVRRRGAPAAAAPGGLALLLGGRP